MKRVAVAVLLLALLGGSAWYVITAMTPVIVVSDIDSILHSTAPPPKWAKVAPEQIAEAKKHGVPVAFENDLGMRFVLIPAGTFVMGSPQNADPRLVGEDEPVHEVSLPRPIYFQARNVTNDTYRRFRPEHDSGTDRDGSLNSPQQPVVEVSWHDATAFAAWLSRNDVARTYRLPAEEEWERACRAGTQTTFYWGDDPKQVVRYGNFGDKYITELLGPGSSDGFAVVAPVGSYEPSAWCLYDMVGNVGEWCQDWYTPLSPSAAYPTQAEAGTHRVLRGGGWPFEWWAGTSAHRALFRPDLRTAYIGFRLASPLPEKSK